MDRHNNNGSHKKKMLSSRDKNKTVCLITGHPWAIFPCALDMAYLRDRTFIAPQGADCSEAQTDSWDLWCSLHLCSFPPCTQLPGHPTTTNPVPTKPPPCTPLGGETISAPVRAEVENQQQQRLCFRAFQLYCAHHASCVWELLTIPFTLYNENSIGFFCNVTQR